MPHAPKTTKSMKRTKKRKKRKKISPHFASPDPRTLRVLCLDALANSRLRSGRWKTKRTITLSIEMGASRVPFFFFIPFRMASSGIRSFANSFYGKHKVLLSKIDFVLITHTNGSSKSGSAGQMMIDQRSDYGPSCIKYL